jgi:hypothetical protein
LAAIAEEVLRTMSEMMSQMMKECCGEDGTPNFEKMKGFMQLLGKTDFSDAESEMLRKFCSQSGKPDAEKMKQLMEKCGC